jgi:hypothetical protein
MFFLTSEDIMLLKLLKIISYNPPRILLTTWSFILMIYIASPIQYRNKWSIKTSFFVFGAIILFYLGYRSGQYFYKVIRENTNKYYRKNDGSEMNFEQNLGITYKLADFTMFLALLGLISGVMFIIEYLFIRGVDYSQGLSVARAQIRDQIAARGGVPAGRIWSLVARFLSGLPPLAAAIPLLRPQKFNSRILSVILIIFSIFVLSISQILTGTRNGIFMIIVFLSMVFILKISREKNYLSHKTIKIYFITFLMGISISFIYFSFIFLDRTALTNMSILETYKSLEEVFLVDINKSILEAAIENQGGFISKIQLIFIYFSIYITHGFHELNLLLSQIPEPGPCYGFYNFSLLLYLANRFGLIPFTLINEVENSMVRQGYYTTLLGYIYIDFGYIFSFVIFLGLGIITGFMWNKFRAKTGIFAEIICAYILFTIVISPFYSPLAAGNGIFFQLLLSIILLSFLVKDKIPKRVKANGLN